MSEIFDKMKSAGQTPSGTSNVGEIGIGDMKKQILERLKEKRQAAAQNQPEVTRPSVDPMEILKAIKKPAESMPDNTSAAVSADENILARKCEELKAELSRNNVTILDLRRKLDDAGKAIASMEAAPKAKEKKSFEVIRLTRDLENSRKLLSETQARFDTLQAESRKALLERDDALRKFEKVRKELDEERSRRERVQADSRNIASDRDEAARLIKSLRAEADVREKLMLSLQEKARRVNEAEEKVKLLARRSGEADKILSEFESVRRASEEVKAKLEAADNEIKRLAALRDEAISAEKKAREDLARKDGFIQDLQAKYSAGLEEITKDRDRISFNTESLRSKLYAATKETKEQVAKIAQFEEITRNKDKRLLELEKACAELERARTDLSAKLSLSQEENKGILDKMASMRAEFESGRATVEQALTAKKAAEDAYITINIQLQEMTREHKELEARYSQARVELEGKSTRLAEIDKLYKELDAAAQDMTARLQVSQRRVKELEASAEDLSLRLSNMERQKKDSETRITEMTADIVAKNMRLEAAENLRREMESTVKGASERVQTSERRAEELKREADDLKSSLKEAMAKLQESESGSRAENSRLLSELEALKTQMQEKERKELELRNSVEHLSTEVQARDTKIESDLAYTDRIVKEVSDLRKKLASLERHTEGTDGRSS